MLGSLCSVGEHQVAVAAEFSNVDGAVAALEKRRNTLKNLKQAAAAFPEDSWGVFDGLQARRWLFVAIDAAATLIDFPLREAAVFPPLVPSRLISCTFRRQDGSLTSGDQEGTLRCVYLDPRPLLPCPSSSCSSSFRRASAAGDKTFRGRLSHKSAIPAKSTALRLSKRAPIAAAVTPMATAAARRRGEPRFRNTSAAKAARSSPSRSRSSHLLRSPG